MAWSQHITEQVLLGSGTRGVAHSGRLKELFQLAAYLDDMEQEQALLVTAI